MLIKKLQLNKTISIYYKYLKNKVSLFVVQDFSSQ